MESEDMFVETPNYSQELDALEEPDNYEEADEKNIEEIEADEESAEKDTANKVNGGLSKNVIIANIFYKR